MTMTNDNFPQPPWWVIALVLGVFLVLMGVMLWMGYCFTRAIGFADAEMMHGAVWSDGASLSLGSLSLSTFHFHS